MDVKRNILAVLLIGLIIALTPYYMSLFAPPVDKNNPPFPQNSDQSNHAVKQNNDDQHLKKENAQKQTDPVGREKIIYIDTELYFAAISNRSGGSFKQFILKKYSGGYGQLNVYDDSAFVSLIPPNEESCAPCLLYTNGVNNNTILLNNYFDSEYSEGDTVYLSNEDTFSLSFSLATDEGFEITKSIYFNGDSYVFNHAIEFTPRDYNYSDFIQFAWMDGLLPTENNEDEDLNNSGVVISQAGEIENFNHLDNTFVPLTKLNGDTEWVAIKTKYFIASLVPVSSQGISGAYSYKNIIFGDREKTPVYDAHIAFPVKNNFTLNADVYLGPMDYRLLGDLGVGLENAMSLGWAPVRPFSKLVLNLLVFLHRFIDNYGLVLILFAIIIRIITGPLTKKSAVSSQKMQSLQPLIKKVNEKHVNDPQKRNQETMNLYKKHGVNPLGGCLPLLIQFPLLFALFTVFRITIEFRGASFFWWIKDLSQPDVVFTLPFSIPIYGESVCVLPLFMGATMFLQQKSSMATMDKAQRLPMYFMSFFFLLLFNTFPSGLNLYYSVSNILNIIQQRSIRKKSLKKKSV